MVKGRLYLIEERGGGVGDDGNDFWGLEEMKGFESDAGANAIFSFPFTLVVEREREREVLGDGGRFLVHVERGRWYGKVRRGWSLEGR